MTIGLDVIGVNGQYMTNTKLNIDDIFEKLSSSMSNPEAQELEYLISVKNYRQAKKELIQHINDEEAKTLLTFYKKKNKEDLNLIETTIHSVNDSEYYIIRTGIEIQTAYCQIKNNGIIQFVTSKRFYEADSINQIWKITPKTNNNPN